MDTIFGMHTKNMLHGVGPWRYTLFSAADGHRKDILLYGMNFAASYDYTNPGISQRFICCYEITIGITFQQMCSNFLGGSLFDMSLGIYRTKWDSAAPDWTYMDPASTDDAAAPNWHKLISKAYWMTVPNSEQLVQFSLDRFHWVIHVDEWFRMDEGIMLGFNMSNPQPTIHHFDLHVSFRFAYRTK